MNANHASQPQLSAHAIHVVSNTDDPLTHLVRLIIERHAQQLPDLSRVYILTPDLLIGRQLRRQLSQAARDNGINALLGPTISTLRSWLESTTLLDKPVMSAMTRELMLIESLHQHAGLFNESNPWYLASSLISLFDELTLQQIELPGNLDDFITRLEKGYGLECAAMSPLSREASMIYTLWHAWHRQQLAEGMLDRHAAYIAKLAVSQQTVSPADSFYLLGYYALLPCEIEWVQHLINREQITIIVQGACNTRLPVNEHYPYAIIENLVAHFDTSPFKMQTQHDTYTEFLDAVYLRSLSIVQMDLAPDLSQRAHQFATSCPESPLQDRLYVFEAYDAEQEAHAIDIQIRRWLLEGKERIGVITEDRRLARRLRALLERANITLQDPAGWALSTTSAASTLERWLETLEEDFDHQPLLDFLKSSFIMPGDPPESRLQSVYRLEQDVILHENIARGLDRYRRHIEYRRKRMSWFSSEGDRISALLDKLDFAAQPLRKFINSDDLIPTEVFDALMESLRRLGIIDTFNTDEAGSRILDEIRQMRQAFDIRRIQITWNDFRLWLGQRLEQTNFSPQLRPGKVLLLNLARSHLQRFDAIIVASAIDKYLPGQRSHDPFFNDAVRHDLGLPGYRESRAQQFYLFRRLLECAPSILISLHRTQDGEALIPSPWLALLLTFHELGYKLKPSDNGLAGLLGHPASHISISDTRILPGKRNYPAPAVADSVIPTTFSATMYQQLVDCPYQFYAAYCLGLKPPEVIREAMEKSDYGERVHGVLQLFHGSSQHAFTQPLTVHTRDAAIEKLTALSHKEFARDLEDNFIHRGWLKQWLAVIPAYIDWQIRRETEWQITAVESSVVNDDFADNFAIKGRLDRIDKNADGQAIVDYKTGTPPKSQETESGEAVQLPFYAMLAPESVIQVEYLKLDKDQVKSAALLRDPSLHDLTKKNAARLKAVFNQMVTGRPLPAWGDEKTCSYCSIQGICRKQSWYEL